MTVPVAPAVTAVVPTHDRPELMRQAVQSILDQDYAGDIEVLVAFDAAEPVPPSVDIPANRTVRVLTNDRARGLAGNRNSGILEASHGFVAFLDDDDAWLPGKLAAQMALFAERPDTVLVATAMVVDDGERLHERLAPSDTVTLPDLLRDRIASLHSSSFVVRTDALLGSLGLVDEAIPRSYGEDYDLLLRAAALAPIAVVNRPLVRVRWQGGSHFVGLWDDYADAWEYLLAKHPGFRADRRNRSPIASKVAFARAAAGHRSTGARWALRSLTARPLQLKSWLALAVAGRLVSADRVVRTLRRFGRGV